MAFVDIKCLESLLIEGEELSIANEGLGSNIKGFIINIFKNIGKILKIIGNLFKGIAMKFRNKKPSESKNSENNTNDEKQIETVGNIFRASVVEEFTQSINNALNYIAKTYQNYIADYWNYMPSSMFKNHNETLNKVEERIKHSDELVSYCNEKAEKVLLILKRCDNKIYYSISQKCSEYCMKTSNQIDIIVKKFDEATKNFNETKDLDVINYNTDYGNLPIENTNEFKRMYADMGKSCAQLQALVIKTQKYTSNIASALNSATIVYD